MPTVISTFRHKHLIEILSHLNSSKRYFSLVLHPDIFIKQLIKKSKNQNELTRLSRKKRFSQNNVRNVKIFIEINHK